MPASRRLPFRLLAVALLAGATEASALSWREIGLPVATAIATDPIRNRMLVFSTRYATQFRDESLVLNELNLADSTWAEILAGPPFERYDQARAAFFDSHTDRAFAITESGRLIEVSFANGPQWGAVVQVPSGNRGAYAYDSKRRRVLGFGGSCNDCPDRYSNALVAIPIDTLGRLHTVPVAGTPPSARDRATMVYDSVQDRLILYGGHSEAGKQGDVWECLLSGTPTWRYLWDHVPVADHVAVYEPISARMWVLGDSAAARGISSARVGSSPDFSTLRALPGPTSRRSPCLTYDAAGARLLYYGGYVSTAPRNGIWALPLRGFDDWKEVAPAVKPPPGDRWSDFTYAAYDPLRDMTLMVHWGLATCSIGWMRADGRWTVGTAVGTTRRRSSTLTFDKRRGRMLLFGGPDQNNSTELFELKTATNPARWTPIGTTGTGPPGRREDHCAVYDSTGDRFIVIGGDPYPHAADPTVWALHLGQSPPRWERLPSFPGSSARVAAYDDARRRVMVPVYGELWWLETGGQWQRMPIEGPRLEPTWLDYDAARDELVGLYHDHPVSLSPAVGGAWFEVDVRGEPSMDMPRVYDSRNTRWLHMSPEEVDALPLPCPSSSLLPPLTLPVATVGEALRHRIEVAPAGALVRYALAQGVLPGGTRLDAVSGELYGTPDVAGRFRFGVAASEASGCVTLRQVNLEVRACVTATAASRCAESSTTRVSFTLSRGEQSAITRWSAWVVLPPGIDLAEPCSGDRCPSVEPGEFYAGCSEASTIRVQRFPGGVLKLEGSISGSACGSTLRSGRLFAVVLRAIAEQAGGEVGVTEMLIETQASPGLTPVASCGPAAVVRLDQVPPVSILDLSARAVEGGSGGTLPIRLDFTAPAGMAEARVYRADATAGAVSAPSSYPPVAPWVHSGATAASPIDHPAARGFYSYAVFSQDSCGNVSPVSNLAAPVANFRLGDFSSAAGACTGDNAVDAQDQALLRAHYGRWLTVPAPDPFACLDIGPTTTRGPDGYPLSDRVIDFEDLAIFAMNFDAGAPLEQGGGAGLHRVRFEVPRPIPSSGRFEVPVQMDARDNLLAVGLRLEYDPLVLALEEVGAGPLLSSLRGRPFVEESSPRDVDLAMCGGVIRGVGEVTRLTFRVIGAGDAALRLAYVEGRDVANRRVAVEIVSEEFRPPASVTFLSPASPNPASGTVSFRVGLAEAGPASLVVFDLQGRRVRDLLRGEQPAGESTVSWDGRGDDGEVQPAGVYVARLDAAGARVTRRWVFAP